MPLDWFRPRGYSHFDVPVNLRFAAKVEQTGFAAAHSFSPFLHFTKETKRYRPRHTPGKVEVKQRPIMYAAHRDACIFSYFSSLAASELEAFYRLEGLSENVIAYRRLGRANYHFSAEAIDYARQKAPCQVLAFDITKFFDSLNHRIMKLRLKEVLRVEELSSDWYTVFRAVTRYRYVHLGSGPIDVKARI